MEVLTDFPERFTAGCRLIWRREGQPTRDLTVAGARPHGDRMLILFEGVTGVDAVRPLLGGELCVPAERAFPAPEGFFYSHEIRGFACEDPRGARLGTAAGVERTPAGALLSITLPSGREALVPFVAEMVVRIDREARRIVLDLPDGLLNL